MEIAASEAQNPLWVISGNYGASARGLLHTRKQTLAFVTSMSVQCQEQTKRDRVGSTECQAGCDGIELVDLQDILLRLSPL
jgi:hypothetical protein